MAAPIPFWYDAFDQWDQCTLGVFVLPGIARVECDRAIKLDIKTLPGQYGATVTNMGNDPASVDITCTLWLSDQWAAMQSIVAALEVQSPKPSRKPQAYAIGHPVTQARGIRGVIIQKILGPRDGAVVGTKEFNFKCVELLKPLKVPPVSPPLNLSSRNSVVPQTPPSIATPPKP